MDISQRAAAGPRRFEPIPIPSSAIDFHQMGLDTQPKKQDFAHRWNSHEDLQSQALRDYRPTVIAIWMRKGGVAKSSTTHMLAHSLAAQGLVTMTVDCDSQQDLTEMTFRAATEGSKFSDTTKYLCDTLLPKDARSCYCLADAVRYVLDDNIARPHVPTDRDVAPSAAEYYNCNLLHPYAFPAQKWNSSAERTEPIPNLFHVVGGVHFEEMETKLSAHCETMFKAACTPNRNAPGALFHAIWQAGFNVVGTGRRGADIIILDLSPTLGRTNQALLMHADYFIMPCETTRMCEKNLFTAKTTIKDWYEEYQEHGVGGTARSGVRDRTRGLTIAKKPVSAELPLPDIEPRFLGVIFTKYDTHQHSKNRDAYGFPIDTPETFKSEKGALQAGYMLLAAENLHTSLSRPGRQGNGFAIPHDAFTSPGHGLGVFRHPRGSIYCPQPLLLGRVRKITTLVEASPAITGLPVNAIDESHFKDLKVPTKEQEQLAHFRRIFEDMAKFIANLPKPDKYNFVFDNRSFGKPENECLLKHSQTTLRYPAEQTDKALARHRTAGRWD